MNSWDQTTKQRILFSPIFSQFENLKKKKKTGFAVSGLVAYWTNKYFQLFFFCSFYWSRSREWVWSEFHILSTFDLNRKFCSHCRPDLGWMGCGKIDLSRIWNTLYQNRGMYEKMGWKIQIACNNCEITEMDPNE